MRECQSNDSNKSYFHHFMAQKEDCMKQDVAMFVPFRVLSLGTRKHYVFVCAFSIISCFAFATC